jgi:hypothetical protein
VVIDDLGLRDKENPLQVPLLPGGTTQLTALTLDDAPAGYRDFDHGAAKKFVLDPNGLVNA